MNAELDAKILTKEQIEILKKQFPIGSHVCLIKMDDEQAPSPGTKGIVRFVDDIGTVFVKWENGSMLGVVLGCDKIKRED